MVGYWKYHLEKLELTQTKMKYNWLKFDTEDIYLVKQK